MPIDCPDLSDTCFSMATCLQTNGSCFFPPKKCDDKKRKKNTMLQNSVVSAAAASHYDHRAEQTREQRRGNAVFQLKLLNNLLKRALLCKAMMCFPSSQQRLVTVVDLCGGKAGDIQKWAHYCLDSGQRLRYALLDASAVEVERAQRRFANLAPAERNCFETAHFICVDAFDLGAVKNTAVLAQQFAAQCNVLSCQFALHYAYESEAKANGFWQVVDWLSSQSPARCVLAVSHPSRQRVIEWCRAHRLARTVNGSSSAGALDNDICAICFADPRLEALLCESTLDKALQSAPQYGACYRFTLRDALLQVPEFLLPSNLVLHAQAANAQYCCVFQTTADEFLQSCATETEPAATALRDAAQVVVSNDEYQVACLYEYCLYKRTTVGKVAKLETVACEAPPVTTSAPNVPANSTHDTHTSPVCQSSSTLPLDTCSSFPTFAATVDQSLAHDQSASGAKAKKTKSSRSTAPEPRRSKRLCKE